MTQQPWAASSPSPSNERFLEWPALSKWLTLRGIADIGPPAKLFWPDLSKDLNHKGLVGRDETIKQPGLEFIYGNNKSDI